MSRIEAVLEAARGRLTRLSPRAAAEALADPGRRARLVDIRPGWLRRREGTIPDAVVIERNHLEWRLDPTSDARIAEATDDDVAWIVVCSEGYTSSLAAVALQDLGLHAATDVVGGFRAWAADGLPTGPGSDAPPDYAREG